MSSALDTVPGGVITLSSDLRILAANLNPEIGVRPAWLVGAAVALPVMLVIARSYWSSFVLS